MVEVAFRGGALVGWVNSTWPFAKLTSNVNQLTLAHLGRYDFTPEQVISIERYGYVPFVFNGLRINHNRPDYPDKMIFWCMGRPDNVLARIEQSGFKANGQAQVRNAGFPIRWSVVIAFIILWNAFMLLDRSYGSVSFGRPGPFALVACLLVLCFSTVVKLSAPLQQRVLSDRHQLTEIMSFINQLQIMSGIFSMWVSASLLFRSLGG